jgi:hypothetical protein
MALILGFAAWSFSIIVFGSIFIKIFAAKEQRDKDEFMRPRIEEERERMERERMNEFLGH